MIRARHFVCLCLALATVPGMTGALALKLPPSARQTSERISAFDGYGLPTAAFDGAAVPQTVVEGRIERRTWRIDGGSLTTLQVLAPLREQLEADGFETLFQCQSDGCGGFDFRFGIEVVPAPDMHVDIQDYRFVSARRGNRHAASVLVSRSRAALFVQIILAKPEDLSADQPRATPAPTPAPTAKPAALPEAAERTRLERLREDGHVILDDLAFDTGGSALEDRSYASLQELAQFLSETPDIHLVLVGHTDSVGDLTANIRLSKRRAGVVRSRLISNHGVDPSRVSAEGNGFLAPIASNLTEAGREANRRVEAILLPR